MSPDTERDLVPRDDALRLLHSLNALKEETHSAAQRWELLDENGHVPAAPSYPLLLQHAADAQDLSREVLRLAADFARRSHHTTRSGEIVLRHLATAATMSSHAAPRFAETAEGALALPRSTHPTDRQDLLNRAVLDHATGRAYLRRTSESLRDAAKELDNHLDLQRFLAPLARQGERPTPPPAQPGGRHR
ncbi:hypothetical protein ACN2WE_30890 [Streptomyces sp. cg28]|uniref:hypothetical protein n=1 Tax=Streptomyces sp. cg28 TaxID=3403457 RepID=UPI003B211B27